MVKKGRLTAVIFCVFLAGLLAWHIVLPDRERSETENRTLAQLPAFSWENLKNGSFTQGVEDYFADQFPLRDDWTGLKARCEQLLGKREFNGVYLCGDTLIARVEEPDEDQVEKNLSCVNKLVELTGGQVLLGLIPSAAEVWKDKLPQGALSFDQAAFIRRAAEKTGLPTVNLLGALSEHADEPIYYRTDHHWTTQGAFYGANALLEALGREPLEERYFRPKTVYQDGKLRTEAVSTDFNGTLYSTSGIHWLEPDAIEYWVPDGYLNVTTWKSGKAEPGQLYDRSYLEGKDKYSSFLGGNQPLCVIENPDIQDGSKILLIRDSYSDSLAPFLAQAFSQVHLIDLRYYHASVAEYMAEHSIKTAVVLYSVANFISDRNLVYLGQAGTVVPEMSAGEAFADFLAGDYKKLNFRSYDFFSIWQYCNNDHLEYTLMDVDGDDAEELLVQYENSPWDFNAVFDYDSGWIDCWELDCVESSRWSELLADGTMLRRYDGNGAYTFYRWLSDGSMEELGPALKYVGDAEWWTGLDHRRCSRGRGGVPGQAAGAGDGLPAQQGYLEAGGAINRFGAA